MLDQPFKPCEFVIEFRAGLRIAVGQIQAADNYAANARFDIAAVRIVRIARQSAADFDRIRTFCQDRDSIPRGLAMPDSTVPRLADSRDRKAGVGCFELLKACDVRRLPGQPCKQVRQTASDAVDIERRNLHSETLSPRARPSNFVAGDSRTRATRDTSFFSAPAWRGSRARRSSLLRRARPRSLHP